MTYTGRINRLTLQVTLKNLQNIKLERGVLLSGALNPAL